MATPEQPAVTSVDDVAAWLNKTVSGTITDAYESAEAYVKVRCTWATPDPDDPDWEWPAAPDDLAQAVRLLTARYLQRRNSPDGTVGMGDLGIVRVPGIDRDIERCMAPWRRVVMA